MPDNVEAYLALFHEAVMSPEDSKEEDDALDRMDALWSEMTEDDRAAVGAILGQKIPKYGNTDEVPS